MTNKAIALENMGDRQCYPCKSSPKPQNNFRVKILAVDGVTPPRRRHVAYGQIVSVPKRALQDIPAK